VTTILDDADDQPQREPTDTGRSDLDDNGEHNPLLVVSISGKLLDSDVTITSHRDAEEIRTHRVAVSPDLDAGTMQFGGVGCDPVTSCEGQTHQTPDFCDRLEDRQPARVAESIEVEQKLRCKAVSTDIKPRRGTSTVGAQDGPRPGRVCDDCRAGISKRTSTTSRERTQRWNSPASQQPAARIQRTTRSAGRQSLASVGDQTIRTRSNFSKDNNRRSGFCDPQNTANQRTVEYKQPRHRDNRAACSQTSTENRTTETAASDRRDVTSGHTTRRSLSAKTASSVTRVPGRRCQSSDDRRQRQKNLTERDCELTQAPFRRKCCCATRNSQVQGQGQHTTSEGQTCSSSRPSERRAVPDIVSKPWARTLRDYGGSDKSPSPVRSRRSTPESKNCPRTSTTTTRPAPEVTSGQDLPANRRSVPPSRTKRPTPADLGITKSDSTLVQRRPDKKLSSAGSLSIPPSSSLGTVTPRRVFNSAAGRNTKSHQTSTERKTTNTTSTKQPDDRPATVTAASQVPCISNRRKVAASSAQIKSKPPTSSLSSSSPVSHSHNTLKTVDVCDFYDLENVTSRAPASTALQPEVFHRTRTRRQSRLGGNDDVSNVTSLAKKKPARKQWHASRVGDIGDNISALSAVNKCVSEENIETAVVNSTHVTSMTSSAVHRDLNPNHCNVGQVACDVAEKKLATNNTSASLSCPREQQLEETLNTCITNFSSDGFLVRNSASDIDRVEDRHSSSDAASFQISQSTLNSITAAHSVQQNSSTSGKEHLVETQANIQEQKSSNYFKNTNSNSGISVTKRREKNSKLKRGVGKCMETGNDEQKSLSPFDELDIERDFEFMDEILSSTTTELYRFIKPHGCHLSGGPNTRFPSTPVDTLLDQLNICVTDSISDSSGRRDYAKSEAVVYSSSTTDVRPAKSIVAGLLYTVNSVVPAPVIEVAQSLYQDHCLSSPPQLSDYVAENHHKVDEVSAEQHQHLPAGPGRRQEDLVDCSPSSDEIVLGSSDTSTKCSSPSPSGSQLSQDSCRWRSPDDSTLVGDLESCSAVERA